MGLGVPNVVHKYNLTDFSKYYYWQVYFQDAGIWIIDGDTVTGTTGVVLDLKVTSTPVHISGGSGLFLMGDILPYLGPETYTGTTSNEYPVATPYYTGNLGMWINNN